MRSSKPGSFPLCALLLTLTHNPTFHEKRLPGDLRDEHSGKILILPYCTVELQQVDVHYFDWSASTLRRRSV